MWKFPKQRPSLVDEALHPRPLILKILLRCHSAHLLTGELGVCWCPGTGLGAREMIKKKFLHILTLLKDLRTRNILPLSYLATCCPRGGRFSAVLIVYLPYLDVNIGLHTFALPATVSRRCMNIQRKSWYQRCYLQFRDQQFRPIAFSWAVMSIVMILRAGW